MSDLFKKHQPRMSDEEDRRLWQQVRVPVARSPVRTAGWRSWFALPAVRYGLPALAVVVVAVVWVVERSPVPPAREAAEQAAGRARPADRAITLPRSDVESKSPTTGSPAAPAPANERAQSQSDLEANKAKSSSAPLLAATKNDAPVTGTVATREVTGAAAPAKDEDKKERDNRAGARLEEERSSEQATKQEGAPQKMGVAQKRVFAQSPAPTPAPSASAPAPVPMAETSPPTAGLGKGTALYRANDALADKDAGNIVDQVLDPARYGPLFGAARGPFADSPARVVAAGSGGPVQVRFAAPAGSKVRHEVAGGTVQVYRVPADAVVRADLAAGAPGEGSALALDGAPVPYERAEPRLQLALVAIEFAQALEARDQTPRARVMALRDAAVRVGARGGPGVTQGAGRLVGMIEGALTGWPAR